MAVMVYVARRRCGCIVGAQVDDADEQIGDDVEARLKQISDVLRIWIRGRFHVDRVAAEDVPAQWFTECPHITRQKRLVDDGASMTVTNPATGDSVTPSSSEFSKAARGT